MTINNSFSLGEFVYLSTDPEQNKRIVTGILVGINQTVLYRLGCGKDESYHYEQEICHERDLILATTN